MSQPFARARAAFALIAAAMALDPLSRRAALGQLPEYASRGKRKTRHHPVKAHARDQRAAAKRRNVLANRKAHR